MTKKDLKMFVNVEKGSHSILMSVVISVFENN